MWNPTNIWVEIEVGNGWFPVMKANHVFGCSHRWRTFLLGHQKYGSKECWSPEKPLRELPDNLSQLVKNDLQATVDESNEDYLEHITTLSEITSTYYTLQELKDIDLDEEIGYPENPDKVSEYEYCVDCILEYEGSEYELNLYFFRSDTIREALNQGGTKEIEVCPHAIEREIPCTLDEWIMAKEAKEKYESQNLDPKDYELLIDEKKLEEKPETSEATLRVIPKKKKSHGHGFKEFISILDKIKREAFDKRMVDGDQKIRVVISYNSQ